VAAKGLRGEEIGKLIVESLPKIPDAGDKLHECAFQNRKRADLGEGLAIWLAPAEYVIIRKLEFFREGGSEKHIEDIRKMLSQWRAHWIKLS